MIRVELGEEVNRRGKWRWTCPRYALAGVSRQPLLDACREIKRMGGDPASLVGLFREARSVPSSTCSVGWGASHTVREDVTRFEKWEPHPMAMVRLKGHKINPRGGG
jgi:hypothetical protein